MDVVDVLQEAGDADSKVHIEYFIFLYTFTSIRLPHLCQGFDDHCAVTANDGGMGKGGRWLIYVRVKVGGQGVEIVVFLILLCFVLSIIAF